jgi:hypothetical protein
MHTTVHVRFGPKATIADQNLIGRFVPILLQKYFDRPSA